MHRKHDAKIQCHYNYFWEAREFYSGNFSKILKNLPVKLPNAGCVSFAFPEGWKVKSDGMLCWLTVMSVPTIRLLVAAFQIS